MEAEWYSVEDGAGDAVVKAVDVGVGVLAITYVVRSEADTNSSEPDPTDGWKPSEYTPSEEVEAVSLWVERGVKSERSDDMQTS